MLFCNDFYILKGWQKYFWKGVLFHLLVGCGVFMAGQQLKLLQNFIKRLNYLVGEALQLSRKKYYSPTDITWAAFVMYGDPTLHLYR